MFENKMRNLETVDEDNPDVSQVEVQCPLCQEWSKGKDEDGNQVFDPTVTPTGLWLVHKSCREAWNSRASLLQEMGW